MKLCLVTSQGTRNPYDCEPTPASAELFWLTVGTVVHGKLNKPTATQNACLRWVSVRDLPAAGGNF